MRPCTIGGRVPREVSGPARQIALRANFVASLPTGGPKRRNVPREKILRARASRESHAHLLQIQRKSNAVLTQIQRTSNAHPPHIQKSMGIKVYWSLPPPSRPITNRGCHLHRLKAAENGIGASSTPTLIPMEFWICTQPREIPTYISFRWLCAPLRTPDWWCHVRVSAVLGLCLSN